MTLEISELIDYLADEEYDFSDEVCVTYSDSTVITPTSSDTEIGSLLIAICWRGLFEFLKSIVGRLENIKPHFNYAGVTCQDIRGATLYHAAARGGSLEMVQYLESKLGLNHQVLTEIGTSPLDFAAQAGAVKICQWIIENKAVDMAWVDASSATNAVQSLFWGMYDETYPSETFDYLNKKLNEHLEVKRQLFPNEYAHIKEECFDVLAKYGDPNILMQAISLPCCNLDFIKWIQNNFNSQQKSNMIQDGNSLYKVFQISCRYSHDSEYYEKRKPNDVMETLWSMISNIEDKDRSNLIKRGILKHDNYKGMRFLFVNQRHRMVMRFLEWAEELNIKNEMMLALTTEELHSACWFGWADVATTILQSQTGEKKVAWLKEEKYSLFWKACRGSRNTRMIEALLTLSKELGIHKKMIVANNCKGFISVCEHGSGEAANLLLSFCEREDMELASEQGKKRARKSLKSSLINALCERGFEEACQSNDINMIKELYRWATKEGVNKKMLSSKAGSNYEYTCLYFGDKAIEKDNERMRLVLQWIVKEDMTYEMMKANESGVFERICQSKNASIVDYLLKNITGEQFNEIISARQYAPFISACLSGSKEVVTRLLNSWEKGNVNRNKMLAADNYKGLIGAYEQCSIGEFGYRVNGIYLTKYKFNYGEEWEKGSSHFYIIKTLWEELSHEQKKQFIVMFNCEKLQYGVVLGLMKLINTEDEDNIRLLDNFIIKTIDPMIGQLFTKSTGNTSATELLLSLFEFSLNYKHGQNIMAYSIINKSENFKHISENIELAHLKEYYEFCIKAQPDKIKNSRFTQKLIDVAKDRIAPGSKKLHEIMMLFPIDILTCETINILKGTKNITMKGNTYSWSYHFMKSYIKVLAEKFNQLYANENLENIAEIEKSLSLIMRRFQFAFEKYKKPFMEIIKDMDNWGASAAYLKANFIFNLFANKAIKISQKNYELFETLCQHPLAEFIPNFNTIDETKNYDQLNTACRKMIECAFKFKKLFGNDKPLLLLQSVIPPLFFCYSAPDTDCCDEGQTFCDKHDLTIMDGNELQYLIKEREELTKNNKHDTTKSKKDTNIRESNFEQKCKAFLKATDPIQNLESKKRKRNNHPNKNTKKNKKKSQTLLESATQSGSAAFFLPATSSLTGANSPLQTVAGPAASARPISRFQQDGIVPASGSEPGASSNF